MRILIAALMAHALAAPFAYGEGNAARPLAVLETTDSASLGVAERLQNGLAEKFGKTRLFTPTTHPTSVTGYTPEALKVAYDQTQAEILSFTYIDKDQIALFLFDVNRPGRYIATSESMSGSPTGRLTDAWLNARFQVVFTALMKKYASGEFEAIPSTEPEVETPQEPEVSRDERGRRLFKELSKIQDGTFYVGTHLGMARFSSNGVSASTVNIGGLFGVKMYERMRFETGVDIFTYLILHGDVRVTLPIAERYVSLNLGMSVNHITAHVTSNRGFNPTTVRTGQLLFGPTLSFDVPLLGATVRGDIKVLFGEATILLGTYGLAYAL